MSCGFLEKTKYLEEMHTTMCTDVDCFCVVHCIVDSVCSLVCFNPSSSKQYAACVDMRSNCHMLNGDDIQHFKGSREGITEMTTSLIEVCD